MSETVSPVSDTLSGVKDREIQALRDVANQNRYGIWLVAQNSGNELVRVYSDFGITEEELQDFGDVSKENLENELNLKSGSITWVRIDPETAGSIANKIRETGRIYYD